MATLKQLNEQLNTTESIKLITQTLGDIAAMELKATKESKEHNIAYFQEISQVYKVVKSISLRLEALAKGQKNLKTIPKPNEGTVCVLLTANSHFFGGLDSELTRFFLDGTAKLVCSRIVVGETGLQILQGIGFDKPYKQVVFEKDDPSLAELKALADECFKFSKVLIFHTKFITILNQQPALSDLSIVTPGDDSSELPFYYITEPEIDKMIQFFDSQISFLMFQAIFIEVNYARLAARMMSMNQAEDNANKMIKTGKRSIITAKKQKLNLELLENYAGLLNKGAEV